MLKNGNKNADDLKRIFAELIQVFPKLAIDYISIADTKTLEEMKTVDRAALISTAVVLNKVRLIDNFIYSPSI